MTKESSRSLTIAIVLSLFFACCFGLQAKNVTVILDPGHGGNDPGAEGVEIVEKTVNLAVAKKVAAILEKESKKTKVLFTRQNDSYISLADRCRVANNKKANLFVSIHCDSSEAHPERYGSTIYAPVKKIDDKTLDESMRMARLVSAEMSRTAGRTNRGVRQRELMVVQYTKMPSVLVELDYICNNEQEKFLASGAGQDKMARAIANAIMQWIDGMTPEQAAAKASATPQTPAKRDSGKDKSTKKDRKEQSDSKDSGKITYKIQFLTSPKQLKSDSREFKGLSPVDFYKDGKIYKYTYGETESMTEACNIMNRVRKLFPDAFIIKIKDGKRIK